MTISYFTICSVLKYQVRLDPYKLINSRGKETKKYQEKSETACLENGHIKRFETNTLMIRLALSFQVL